MTEEELQQLLDAFGGGGYRKGMYGTGPSGSVGPVNFGGWSGMMPNIMMSSSAPDYEGQYLKDRKRYNEAKRGYKNEVERRKRQEAMEKERLKIETDRRKWVADMDKQAVKYAIDSYNDSDIAHTAAEEEKKAFIKAKKKEFLGFTAAQNPYAQMPAPTSRGMTEREQMDAEYYSQPGMRKRGYGWIKLEEDGPGGKEGTEFFMDNRGRKVKIEPIEGKDTYKVTGILGDKEIKSQEWDEKQIENLRRSQLNDMPPIKEKKASSFAGTSLVDYLPDYMNPMKFKPTGGGGAGGSFGEESAPGSSSGLMPQSVQNFLSTSGGGDQFFADLRDKQIPAMASSAQEGLKSGTEAVGDYLKQDKGNNLPSAVRELARLLATSKSGPGPDISNAYGAIRDWSNAPGPIQEKANQMGDSDSYVNSMIQGPGRNNGGFDFSGIIPSGFIEYLRSLFQDQPQNEDPNSF